jgi:hypothetical protein
MSSSLLIIALVVPVMVGAAILVGRYLHRPRGGDAEVTPVVQQHFELYQGGNLNEPELNAAKRHYADLLRRGDCERIESGLRPGLRFVVKVRALADLGTDDASAILERQLARRHCTNPLEQNWYWIDLANGLRAIGREQSIPHLLDRMRSAEEMPLLHLYAAETVCFPGFKSYLREYDTAHGAAALRVLHRAVEGLRNGVPPQVVVEACIGEMVETVWDRRPEEHHPLLVRLFLEVQRHLRRAESLEDQLDEEPFEREAYHLQRSRLAALESAFDDYLTSAGAALASQLSRLRGPLLKDALQALNDLRYDASAALLGLLNDPHFAHRELATLGLRWSRDQEVGEYLRDWACQQMQPHLRALKPMRAWPPRRPSAPTDFPYRAVLATLRSFPAPETEQLLLTAAHDWDPTFRVQAIASLCWWEPFARAEVLLHLQSARFDHNADVRHAARAALARLGERQALQWFRQALSSDSRQCVLDAIQTIANEGLTLLWPDLDRLVDLDEPDLVFFAREALEQMNEELDYSLRRRV